MRLDHLFAGQPRSITLVMLAIVLMVTSFSGVSADGGETQVYVGHRARLSAEIPADWTVPPDGTADYSGPGGFVYSSMVGGQDLEAVCSDIDGIGLVSVRAAERSTWNGAPACEFEGSFRGQDALGVVVHRPEPVQAFGEELLFAALIADPAHLESILRSVSFDAADVSPQSYIHSVLDIMEARAWYAPEVDWERLRGDDLGLIESATTYEDTHWVISEALGSLRAWGDNHSFFNADDGRFTSMESHGTGMYLQRRTVWLVYPDSSAGRADIRVGDTIVAVNGAGFNGSRWIEEAIGTGATVEITRAGVPEPISVDLEPGPFSNYLPPIVAPMGSDVGYAELFTTIGADPVQYARDANEGIARVDDPAMCGWIVDLRRNGGGGYGPMVMGVGSIMGNGHLFTFVDRDGREWRSIHFRDGRFHDGDRQGAHYLDEVEIVELSTPSPPVAVLIGPYTASAGELTAVAFVGRADTRLFGEKTGGYTIGNNGYPLFDGAYLGLAESTYADRTGGMHIGGVEPDEVVATDWTTYGTADDPVITAASSWIREHPSCETATPGAVS